MNTPEDKQPLKSQFCNASDDQLGLKKPTKLSGYEQSANEALKLQLEDNQDTLCSDTWIFFQELEASAWQQSNSGEYRQLSLWKSTPMLNSSCDRTSQEYQSTQISETTSPEKENSIFYRWDSLARVQVTQEAEQDYLTQNQHFGEKDLDVLLKLNPSSVLSNNLKELSNEDFELFLVDSVWQDTVLRLKQSRRRSLEQDTKDSDYLSFPTLTSGQTSSKMRPAGQTKCEKWFKDNGLIPNGWQLGAQAIASLMNFPTDWFNPLSPVKPQAELEPGILQDEQLLQPKQRSPSVESSISQKLLGGDENSPLQKDKRSSPSREISIPCLVKQPGQTEVRGIIRKDLGDRFLVDVSDKTISISKLFVYPDFSESVGQLDKIPPSKKVSPPSKIPPTKSRRKKGDGTGYIYRRTITRREKQYEESYYRYRDESGKLRSKYIPQKLLCKVQEAESRKKPIADILVLLGGDEISRGEQFSTLNVQNNESDFIDRGEQSTPPSKKRKQGDGTGYIECKPIKRSAKEYKQYWYHYEEWREGDRLNKKSKYIPKTMLNRIEQMNSEKVPVEEILKVLRKR
jgi:hypothetical protein